MPTIKVKSLPSLIAVKWLSSHAPIVTALMLSSSIQLSLKHYKI